MEDCQALPDAPAHIQGDRVVIFTTGPAPVNTDYRYADDELPYKWYDVDTVAVGFHDRFGEHTDTLRHKLPT